MPGEKNTEKSCDFSVPLILSSHGGFARMTEKAIPV